MATTCKRVTTDPKTKGRSINSLKTSKIAIMVVNDYGDEALKVYEVEKNGKKRTAYSAQPGKPEK